MHTCYGRYGTIASRSVNTKGGSAALVGTLSKDDDDGIENVGKKMNLRSFKVNRVY